MRRLAQLLACCLLFSAPTLAVSTGALAKGPKPSAGDNQYIDPLASTTGTTTAIAPPPATTTTSPPSTLSQTPPSENTTTTTSPPTSPSGGALPFTGLNLGAVLAIGLGLLAVGLVLRRLAKRASDS